MQCIISSEIFHYGCEKVLWQVIPGDELCQAERFRRRDVWLDGCSNKSFRDSPGDLDK